LARTNYEFAKRQKELAKKKKKEEKKQRKLEKENKPAGETEDLPQEEVQPSPFKVLMNFSNLGLYW